MLKSFRFLSFILFLDAVLVMPSTLCAEDIDTSAYVRVRYSEKMPNRVIALDTAVVHFESKSGDTNAASVDLIGAVHIADAEYYAKLNQLFTAYDTVLYELVAEEGTRPDPKVTATSEASPGLIGGMQTGMAGLFRLEHQLHHIDYTPQNMVHADMDPDVFLERMFADGEWINIFRRVLIKILQQDNTDSDKTAGRLLGSFLATRDKSLSLKRTFAVELCRQMQEELWIFEGDEGSTLIHERNACALVKLREAIGRNDKKIAVFYGAAHFDDFTMQLEKSFDLKPVKTTWIKAWDLGENSEQ